MKKLMFAIEDSKTSFMESVFLDSNRESAIRGFSVACRNSDVMRLHPEDFNLFLVGEFDTETGSIDSYSKIEYLINATAFFGEDGK